MKVALASDHAGFPLKEAVRQSLAGQSGLEVIDFGAHDETPSDYPDFAEKIGDSVRGGRAERGVLLCGSGVGACIAANKIPGVRAGLCHDHYSAHQGLEHDDMNVLVLGARVVGAAPALEAVNAFLHARFTGEERHVRRLQKVAAIETKYSR